MFLMARRKDLLESLAGKINKQAGREDQAVVLCGDVTNGDDREKAVEAVLEQAGQVDVLVNNAGFALGGVIEDLDLQKLRDELEVNTVAPLAMMQLVGPLMRKQRAGRIINMSSISGVMAVPGLGGYAASKFALEALSDAARREYHQWGVKVILIQPGGIATDIWKDSHQELSQRREESTGSDFETFYKTQQERFLNELMEGNAPGAEIVARAVCHAATADKPKCRYCMPRQSRLRKFVAHWPTSWQDRMVRHYVPVQADDGKS